MSCLRGDNSLLGKQLCVLCKLLEVIKTILSHGVSYAELVFTISDRKRNFSVDIV